MNIVKCDCGAEISFITMGSGKKMPVDAKPVQFVVEVSTGATGRIYGDMRKGYVPHWGTCPLAKKFKKKKGD